VERYAIEANHRFDREADRASLLSGNLSNGADYIYSKRKKVLRHPSASFAGKSRAGKKKQQIKKKQSSARILAIKNVLTLLVVGIFSKIFRLSPN
jgi:uncharacterized ion transporter superfamily protein YfcC